MPDFPSGHGEWVDLAGLIAPKLEVDALIADVLSHKIDSVDALNQRLAKLHGDYYDMEWTWAYRVFHEYFGLDPEDVTSKDLIHIVEKWIEAVTTIDNAVYADAKKEFSLSAKTGFGADGSIFDAEKDFEQVRGIFESNSFVKSVCEHIEKKTALGQGVIERLKSI